MLPLPRELTRMQWIRRFTIWFALLLALALLIRLDVMLMRWRFMAVSAEPSGAVRQLLFGLRDFGQIVPMLAAMVLVWLTDRRRVFFVCTLLFAQLLAALMCQPVKWGLPRYRPHAAMEEIAAPRVSPEGLEVPSEREAGEEPAPGQDYVVLLAALRPGEIWIWSDSQSRPRETRYESFPSGHSAAAFAFAGVLAWFYPHLAGVFWALAVGCALSRYVDAVHWPGDCMAGAILGYVAAWMALRPYVWVLPVILVRRRLKRRQAVRRRRAGVRPVTVS